MQYIVVDYESFHVQYIVVDYESFHVQYIVVDYESFHVQYIVVDYFYSTLAPQRAVNERIIIGDWLGNSSTASRSSVLWRTFGASIRAYFYYSLFLLSLHLFLCLFHSLCMFSLPCVLRTTLVHGFRISTAILNATCFFFSLRKLGNVLKRRDVILNSKIIKKRQLRL